MPNPFKLISKPEYILHPSQILKRFGRMGRPKPEQADVRLPWDAIMRVHTRENVGSDIYHYGIFDKIVPETIWRLLDKGEMALEIGANIGQNALAMAARTGRHGRVIGFEPHPEIFMELKENCRRSQHRDVPPVQLENVALGATTGEALLVEGDEFFRNRGVSSLQNEANGQKTIPVKVRRLDEYLSDIDQVGVCKIDVEGHELSVLEGAEKTLNRRGIRDIIFEDFNRQPSPVTTFLKQRGFTLFELYDTWMKPRLTALDESKVTTKKGFTFNYLATLNPDRAIKCFRSWGWHCLLHL